MAQPDNPHLDSGSLMCQVFTGKLKESRALMIPTVGFLPIHARPQGYQQISSTVQLGSPHPGPSGDEQGLSGAGPNKVGRRSSCAKESACYFVLNSDVQKENRGRARHPRKRMSPTEERNEQGAALNKSTRKGLEAVRRANKSRG